jgi:hypothetical protein
MPAPLRDKKNNDEQIKHIPAPTPIKPLCKHWNNKNLCSVMASATIYKDECAKCFGGPRD